MQHKTLDVSIAIAKVVMRIDLRGTGNFTTQYTAGQLPHYYQPTIATLITSH
jgi:hypothetical protein